ncbi:MAG: hypothetical protein AAF557_08325 [Pseudomonadota bacterium]
MSLDLTIASGPDIYASPDPIAASTLGIEFLGWETFASFQQRLIETEAPHVRWPGGLPAEDGIDIDGDGSRDPVYDLRASDLIIGWDRANGPREGLTDVLGAVVEANASFAMLVPTARYVALGIAGPAGVDQARADIRQFLERFAAGDFGAVPQNFTLEIGSEYYATKVWKDNLDVPDLAKRFGEVFAALADEAKQTIADLNAAGQNPQGINPMVAIQVGRLQSADDIGNFDGQFSDNLAFVEAFRTQGAEYAIDALIWHRYIPHFDQIGLYVNRIPTGGYADPQTAYLATTLDLWQDLTQTPLDLVGGWLSPSSRQGESLEYGAPGLSNILQHFASMISAGMDTGSIFGFASARTGSLGRAGDLFLGGQLYQMMIESLPGLRLHDGFQANLSSVLGDALVQSDHVNAYVFEDDAQYVIFLAAKDFAGTHLDYDLVAPEPITSVRATHLIDPNGIDRISADNIGVVGQISESQLSVSGGQVTVRFTTDYEVIRLVLTKATADPVPSHSGTEESETLLGSESQDVLDGLEGADKIYGRSGDDTLIDGVGKDNLFGGDGADTFRLVRDGDADSIKDFDVGLDRIDLSAWGVTQIDELVLSLSKTGKTTIRFADEVLSVTTGLSDIPDAIALGDAFIFAPNNEAQIIDGTAGDDKLNGMAGRQILRDGAGRDNLWGGAGADTFQLSKDGDADAIKDFELGADLIDLTAWGAGYQKLEITDHRSGKVTVRFADEVLSVTDAARTLSASDLTADHFVF